MNKLKTISSKINEALESPGLSAYLVVYYPVGKKPYLANGQQGFKMAYPNAEAFTDIANDWVNTNKSVISQEGYNFILTPKEGGTIAKVLEKIVAYKVNV